MNRREFLERISAVLAILGAKNIPLPDGLGHAQSAISSLEESPIPTRLLGKTGHVVRIFSLGGEGVLRTTGCFTEAKAVIEKALDCGVNYCDTAPAYQQSQDYYGATLGKRRDKIFLASKTHERSKRGSLRLLEESLRRLKTDHLDLWQLHDLRSREDIEEIFGRDGAIEAVEEAKKQGKIHFAGITGHTDPVILLEAMSRYAFDTVLLPVNVADKARLSFIQEVVPVANQRGMGVIGMKVMGHGDLFDGLVSAAEAMQYALSHAISTVIIGCSSPREVASNAAVAQAFKPLSAAAISALEAKIFPHASSFNLFKR